MKKKHTLREYINANNILESDIDVYVDGIEGLAVVFPIEFTAEGEKHFKDALDKCWVEPGSNIIEWSNDDTDDDDGIPKVAYLAWDLIAASAGWCTISDHKQWFKH